MRTVNTRARFRSEDDYDAYLDTLVPCITCGIHGHPSSWLGEMFGCECGDLRCERCHERRTCCGEHKTHPCPNPTCGDFAVVEFNGLVWITICASACREDTPGQPWGFAQTRERAIAAWNDAVSDWLDGREEVR